MSIYKLKIMTPEKTVYESEITSMTVTCENGQMTVLAGHAPMVAMLTDGPLLIRTGQKTVTGIAGDGILWVDHNESAVMVHSFAWDNGDSE